jgi:hypothetical protein
MGFRGVWNPVELADCRSYTVYVNPMSRSRVGRIAWSWFRHPVKSREFPAKHERLITMDDLMRLGV